MTVTLFAIGLFLSVQANNDLFCLAENGQGECSRCALSFVNHFKRCQLLTAFIPNCLVYKGDNWCEECQFGFTLNKGSGLCETIPVQDCLYYDYG